MMEKRRSLGIKIFTLLGLVFAVITTWSSIVGIRLFSGDWLFKNPQAHKLSWAMLPFAILFTAGGIGILFLKQWARMLFLVTAPAILVIYALLFMVKGIDLTLWSLLYVLAPVVFICYFMQPAVKGQFK